MTKVWPTTGSFPGGPLVGSWTYKREPNVIRMKPEVGSPLERRRASVSVSYASFNLILTSAQLATLDDFYFNQCLEGIIPFTFTNPETDASETWFWDDSPSHSMISIGIYKVACSLRRNY